MQTGPECYMNLRTGAVSCTLSGPLSCPATPANYMLNPTMDDPLNRILQPETVGPWTVVGYVTTLDTSMAQSRDRTMMLHAQLVRTRRERYNYRVIDSNGVALDVGEKVSWMMHGSVIAVPGQASTYTVHLYQNFR